MAKTKAAANTAVQTEKETATAYRTCECCEPKQNLFPRPDLAGIVGATQIAKIALCIFHKPNPTVYVWNIETEKYERRDDLQFSEQQVRNADGSLAFTASTSGAPSLLELDDDEEARKQEEERRRRESIQRDGGSRPQTGDHVDLEKDDFWRGGN